MAESRGGSAKHRGVGLSEGIESGLFEYEMTNAVKVPFLWREKEVGEFGDSPATEYNAG